jgi:Kef-type K+ transport system membrane component KefB
VIAPLIVLMLGGLMHAARSFAPSGPAGTQLAFGYLLLTAYFTAQITSRVGLPRLTGYLIAGMVTGPYLLDLVGYAMTSRLALVKGTAVCLIGLSAGSGLVWQRIRPHLATIVRASTIPVLGTSVVLAGAVIAMRPWLPFFDGVPLPVAIAMAFVIGTTLSAKSPAVVLALTDETGSQGKVTDLTLASVVTGDLVTIVGFAVAAAVAGGFIGAGVDPVTTAMSLGWGLGGSAAFGILLGLLLGVFVARVERGHAVFAVLLCVVVAVIAPTIAIDPLITMIAAGISLRNLSRTDATALLDTLNGAALPIYLVFFAVAGAEVHLDELVALVGSVAVLVACRAGGFFVFGRLATARHPDEVVRKTLWVGFLPQAGLALALALLFTESLGELGGAASSIVFGVVAVNEMISPVVLRAVMMRSQEAGQRPRATGGH